MKNRSRAAPHRTAAAYAFGCAGALPLLPAPCAPHPPPPSTTARHRRPRSTPDGGVIDGATTSVFHTAKARTALFSPVSRPPCGRPSTDAHPSGSSIHSAFLERRLPTLSTFIRPQSRCRCRCRCRTRRRRQWLSSRWRAELGGGCDNVVRVEPAVIRL